MYFEVYQSANGWFYWRLKSSNHKIVADGAEGYVSQRDALNGISLVQGTSSLTPVYKA